MPLKQETQNENKETRQHLLECAKREFLEKGYMKASLRNICKAAGVTTGALYFFFKDKEDLLAALVEEPLRQQIVLDVEDALGVFLVPRLSRDIADVVYPVGDGFRFCYHGSSSSSLSFLVPSGRRLSVRSLSSTPVMRSASLPSSLSHPSMNG